MMAGGKKPWRLEDLVDFERALHQSPSVDAEVGREVREGLRNREFQGNEKAQRRWGMRRWLESKADKVAGKRVVGATQILGVILFIVTFLIGVGIVRGLVHEFEHEGTTQFKGFNLWVLLMGTLGIQWLFLMGSLFGFFVVRRFTGGLGFFRQLLAKGVQKLAGNVDTQSWQSIFGQKVQQRTAGAWRLGRVVQFGGVGLNLGLISGFFGVLWFLQVGFYWESTLPMFGRDSLHQVTHFLSLGIDPFRPSVEVVERSQRLAGRSLSHEHGDALWPMFFLFVLFLWGLLPRLILWGFSVYQEKKALAAVDFQDPEHRKLWRQLTRVERTVVIDGPSDGVVLLDVGGLSLEIEKLRPFLLQTLRVNPEKEYSVSVLDAAEERDAWEAMKKAPCGVILLVEGWSLSPKQMTILIERIRKSAGEETVLRVLVMGDGLTAPSEGDFTQWQRWVDGLRDPKLECVAFEEGSLS